MKRAPNLDVYLNADLVGRIHDTSPLSFEYSPQWLDRPRPMAIAAIELQPGVQSGMAVQAFFENLLPEGELRTHIAVRMKASTLYSLLLATAGDTSGSFVILPAGETLQPPSYEETSWEALGALLKKRSITALDIKAEGTRISLAGAQDKASIAIFKDAIPRIPKGTSPSTHILKPDIRRLDKVWESAANEAIIMSTAARCGLPTAEVFYELQTRSCVVERFDRFLKQDGSLGRLVQYDFCQLGSVLSGGKYEKEGGPGIAACAALIRRYSSQPGVDLRNFISWIFFNLCTGNNDSHAKNLSIFHTPEAGVRLTPFYDLMCTRLYSGLSQEFAYSIGGETRPGSVTMQHLALMSQSIGVQPIFTARIAANVARRIPHAIHAACESLAPTLTPRGRTLAQRLELKVLSLTRQTAKRVLALDL